MKQQIIHQNSRAGAAQVMAQIETLARLSALPDAVLRAYLTPEHKAAHAQIAQWMCEAGLAVWQDEAGNQWGRKVAANPTQPPLIVGSHSDTVVDAGKYDGPLGILMAIEALAQLKDVDLPYHVDVVAFADEEGTRFRSTLLGSSAVAGHWQPNWFDIEDEQGVTMRAAFEAFGLDPQRIGQATRSPQSVMAYLEVHIEQGPVLESLDLPVGVVTAIAGAKRFMLTLTGEAGHAGTVPISLRQDALCAAAEMILHIEAFAKQEGLVATVGCCDVQSAAVNVIPGQVTLSLDIRSQAQAHLDQATHTLFAELMALAQQRQIQLQYEQIYQAQAVPCAPHLIEQWGAIVEAQTQSPTQYLASGAGHDAMMMAHITDVAMLFIRCEKGISHNPLENVKQEDVAVGLSCLTQMLTQFQSE